MATEREIIEKLASKSKIHLILVQGGTCAGKTLMSEFIYRRLSKAGVRVFKMSTDDYYKSSDFSNEDEKYSAFDFDNPAAFHWDAIKRTFQEFASNKEKITKSSYDFRTQQRNDVIVENIHPEVIIFEGIYSFNLFNRETFDIEKLDPRNAAAENPDAYKVNDSSLIDMFSVLKLEMILEKDDAKRVRVDRDCRTRFENSTPEFKKVIENKFDKLVWPSTEKWVYSDKNESDIRIKSGTFNIQRCEEITSKILKCYEIESEKGEFNRIAKEIIREKN